MKIEKLNENQIRCTLTRADLAARQLKLSELAYGTEKAKSLFRDMMQQASFDFGFEADNIPLMIEAIPSSADSIVLIITKVEDPEELDTRFSKFTPFGDGDSAGSTEILEKLQGADDFFDLLDKVKKATADITPPEKKNSETSAFPVRLFSFETLDGVIEAARLIAPLYHGSNTLYKDTSEDMFLLALSPSDHPANEFNKICNMLSEYGSPEKGTPAILAYLEEHCDTVISANAVWKLASL